ncbi:23S rRNA (guanosine(2251)-2'-O)-methyltransferase RlmB [Telmatospirillum siberiense]|uniref:23S rRNA (Guanosine(2251)-2'-O)-methyltransferase RlmB n=1 Tax=Telmatospirillum siberiense TaxID=382514 RepID=A0A2N3PPG0_9PROT|nr:23S rRNA (guanosine(2251)-2'-O)-methyltransferase RlmB [Telmatospirillum siberiense]PKU22278.1 23S rRNA (guanosine(2251)-2'-O)-methyltransferase RlmB [Telmatospirillum siberiense]
MPRAARSGGSTFWLWGSHPVLAALANPDRHCRRLLLTAEALRTHGPQIAALAQTRPLPQAETVEKANLDGLLPAGAVHQGIALAAEPLETPDIGELAAAAEGRESAVIICLDQVTDPHNVGAVLRSAAAFGALGLLIPDRHAPDETGTLAKSASGALERLPLVRVTNLVRALEELKQAGFWIAGLAGDAPLTLAEAKLSGKLVLVLGSEGEGLRRLTREHCDHLVKLPQTDLVESLNVSNAAAVALYELVRR